MLGITLISLFIIQSSNVMADQQDVTKVASKSNTESKSNKSTSEGVKKQVTAKQISSLQTSSSSESSQTLSVISNSNSKQAGLSSSSASNELSSVEKIKQKTDQMTSGKKSNSRLLNSMDIDDGIDWNPVAVKQETQKKIKMDKKGHMMLFGFGNGNGSLAYWGIGADDKAVKYTDHMPPKINLFLENPDGTRMAMTNYGDDLGTSGSQDFSYTPNGSNFTSIMKDESIAYLMDTGFQVFEGTTQESGKPALKVVGTAHVRSVKFDVEILLRPDEEQPVLHTELYIKSPDKEVSGGIYYSQELGARVDSYQALKAQAHGHGMYVEEDDYKYLMNFKVTDGPFTTATGTQVYGQNAEGFYASAQNSLKIYSNGTRGSDVDYLNGLTPGNGAQGSWADKGTVSYVGEGTGLDSGTPGMPTIWSAKYPWSIFNAKGYNHYQGNIGLITKGVVVPDVAVEFENITNPPSKDDPSAELPKNHVRDEMSVRLMAHNLGYESTWNGVTISATIPKELDFDEDSVRVVPNYETDWGVENRGDKPDAKDIEYNRETRQLKVKLPNSIEANKWSAIMYTGTINSYGAGKWVNHSVFAQGDGTEPYDKASGTNKFYVEKNDPDVGLVKEVKNETRKDKNYMHETDASPKETLSYKLQLWVNSGSVLNKPDLADDFGALESGGMQNLEYVKGSAKVQYDDGATESLAGSDDDLTSLTATLPDLEAGHKVTITYQAKVKEGISEGTKIKNTVIGSNPGAYNDGTNAIVDVAKPQDGDVIFRYIDRKTGAKIADDVKIHGPNGKKVSELQSDEMAISELESDGITWGDSTKNPNKIRPMYISDYTPVDYIVGDDLAAAPEKIADVDPIIQSGDPVIYTFRYEKTRLEITALPAKMNFGKFYETQADRTFYLPATAVQPRAGDNHYQKKPYSIEISDFWGIKGWSLSVQQDQQFHFIRKAADGTDETVNLDGAQLKFSDARFTTHTEDRQSPSGENDNVITKHSFTIEPGVAPQKLIDYQRKGQYLEKDGDNTKNLTYDSPGYSVHKYQFGDEKTADYSIGLHVPGTTKRYAKTYLTTLLWNLTVAP